MKERIKQIMESEDMTPARFADTLEIGRAVISHILNGRNNPSLDIVMRILQHFPRINPDWLLYGAGNVYREDISTSEAQSQQIHRGSYDLFSQPSLFTPNQSRGTENNVPKPISSNDDILPEQVTEPSTSQPLEKLTERIVYRDRPEKKVSQIIIYYTDNTFEIFQTSQKG